MNCQRHIREKVCLSFVAAASVLLAVMATTTSILGPASAQIMPSASMPDSSASPQSSVLPKSLQPADSGIEFNPHPASIQNSTTTNITQLATVLPTVDQPITPASFAPVDTESDDDSDNDNGNNDNEGEGGGSVAIAGGGGAFAVAG